MTNCRNFLIQSFGYVFHINTIIKSLFCSQLAHHELEEEVKKKDCELNELEEFTRIEADMKNTSLMEKRHQVSSI